VIILDNEHAVQVAAYRLADQLRAPDLIKAKLSHPFIMNCSVIITFFSWHIPKEARKHE